MTSKHESRVDSIEGIQVRGARVHNLKSVDVDIPYRKLTVFCGPSGSGKTSLAIDTLYADSQRRFLECLAPYARAFIETFEKPDVDSVEGALPSSAVMARQGTPYETTTVGSATETFEHLRTIFSRLGVQRCLQCGRVVKKHEPAEVWETLKKIAPQRRILLCYNPGAFAFGGNRKVSTQELKDLLNEFEKDTLERGFHRVILEGNVFNLDKSDPIPLQDYHNARLLYQTAVDPSAEEETLSTYGLRKISKSRSKEKEDESDECSVADGVHDGVLMLDPDRDYSKFKGYLASRHKSQAGIYPWVYVVVARLSVGDSNDQQGIQAIEAAMNAVDDCCWVFVEGEIESSELPISENAKTYVDSKEWTRLCFSSRRHCAYCAIEYLEPTANLFNYSRSTGACDVCGGEGSLVAFDEDLIVPDKNKTLEGGAIAPWLNVSSRARTTRRRSTETGDADSPHEKYKKNLEKYVPGAVGVNQDETLVPLDVVYSDLTREQRRLLFNGSSASNKKGLNGYFTEVMVEKSKMNVRLFLSRYQKTAPCLQCQGKRFRKEALSVTFGGKTIYEWLVTPITTLIELLDANPLPERYVGSYIEVAYRQLKTRLEYLRDVGLGYLTLERKLRTLSSGEQRRVQLPQALGSDLVDMLYILDEPSAGLHQADAQKIASCARKLCDRGVTVVAVDHSPELIRSADKVVEFGPDSGDSGGNVVFSGTPEELEKSETSRTGIYLSGRRQGLKSRLRAEKEKNPEYLTLKGATGHNLHSVDVKFPLHSLCVVTGVSGAGKTSLISGALYPALSQKFRISKTEGESAQFPTLSYDSLEGYEKLEEVIFVDQTPIGRTPRSNPATYLRVFDEIRALFAETVEAKANGFTAGHFSFNVDVGRANGSAGESVVGRCNFCKGEGYVQSGLKQDFQGYVKCPLCHGKRYQERILDVKYRSYSIADILDMTAAKAYEIFRGRPKIQQRLRYLLDVGLGYLPIGQPGNTLSTGESQRLKLAQGLSTTRRNETLYIMDEPTAGLHFSDVARLVEVFDKLVSAGASLIVIDHHPQLIQSADYVVDLGPGAGEEGGCVVATGNPWEIAACPESLTGQILKGVLPPR
ncbi:MAG: excinuclease ABC subunit UvrA [Planctomycetia bacterium]|nr:excinuclease ABC subunit UvrA [Planctomycetia bacterium]